ncbi:MAG: restriction endonuclease subunit S [Pseudomonadota bacterium]|nr:restriction endonuclease subunit S [Pseudomonadota bacterium]
MSRYREYPEYKNSDAQWFEKVPAHWETKKISHIASMRSGDAITSESIKEEGQFPVFGGNGLRGYTGSYNLDGRYILIGRQGALCGNINYGFGKFWASEHAVVVYPLVKVAFNWLGETLRAMNLNQYNVSAAQPGLAVANIICLKVPFPPFEEQQKIANFLDHETAKIDTLIEKQQQLIKLLKEKRQAVISHAVTKGLNPNAPLRDSGVEWLGEVPEHWTVTKLKYSTTLFEQGWSPQCDSRPAEANEYGVLKVGCVNNNVFNSSENKALPKELDPQLQYLVRKGDLLISRANTKELVGSAAVVNRDYGNLILCDKLYRLNFDAEVNPEFVSMFLALPIVRQQIELEATGASHSMQNIGQATVKELVIALPSKKEADDLVADIYKKTETYDGILFRSEIQIRLLQERRTALISAAVTGKIDVRNWQPPADPSANHESPPLQEATP